MLKMGDTIGEQDLDQISGLLRLLADRTRLNILLALADGERNVTSLCEQLGLPQPTVSHHLGLLRINNVIANRRKGKQVFYTFNATEGANDGAALEIGVEKFAVRISKKPE
jgi:DNA-binding transcriptional ArsR family regulator